MANKIEIVGIDGSVREVSSVDGITVLFTGDNATVRLSEPFPSFKKCRFELGTNGLIEIKKSSRYMSDLVIQATALNSKVLIGENFSCYSTNILIKNEKDLSVIIGDGCMFASSTKIRTSDAHSIVDLTTGKVVNHGKDVVIGNHVWLTLNTAILKGVKIPDWTIVALGSVVTKSYEETHCILAGAPARIVKHNVSWDYRDAFLMDNPLGYNVSNQLVSEVFNVTSFETKEVLFESDICIAKSDSIWNAKILPIKTLKKDALYCLNIDGSAIKEGECLFYQFAIKDLVKNKPCYIKNIVVGCALRLFFKLNEDLNNIECKIYSGEAGVANNKEIEIKNFSIKEVSIVE